MKFYLSLNPKKNIYYQINLAKSIGYDGVEIILEDKILKTVLKEKEKVLKLIKNLKIEACFHLPFWLNILEKKDLKKILDLNKIALEFNSFSVVHLPLDRLEDLEILEKISNYLRGKNIYFENLFQPIELLEEVFKLNLKFVIDISHFISFNSISLFKTFLEKNRQKIYHFHLSDGYNFSHSHLPLGKGEYPLKQIIFFLYEKFKNNTISLEIFETDIPEIEFEISLNILKEIIKKV